MMVIGEMLTCENGTTTSVFSPWFEACGDGATFAIELGPRSPFDEGELEVRVQTKGLDEDDAAADYLDRKDETGSWVPWGPLPFEPDDSPILVSTARYEGFKELVRFQYLLETVPPVRAWRVHCRMLPPLWQNNCLECTVEKQLVSEVQPGF